MPTCPRVAGPWRGDRLRCPEILPGPDRPLFVLEDTLSIITGYDAVTLREEVDLTAATERLDAIGSLRSLSALNEKVSLLRLVGRLDEAWEIANEAWRLSRFTGEREHAVASRIRRAQVLHYQGKLDEAATELNHCILDAETHEWTNAAAEARQNRGKVLFDQGRLEAALTDFTAAVLLREKDGATAGELEGCLVAVSAVEAFIAERAARR